MLVFHRRCEELFFDHVNLHGGLAPAEAFDVPGSVKVDHRACQISHQGCPECNKRGDL
jgi:hypothetical protein